MITSNQNIYDLYTIKQLKDLKYGNKRWNIKTGATRSGKTYLDIKHKIVNRIIERKGLSGLNIMCGADYGSIDRNVIKPLREVWGNLIGAITKTSMEHSIHVKICGEPVLLFGGGDKGRMNKLRGSSVKYAYCDEVVSYDEGFFNMLKSRLDKEYSVCDLTCNPETPNHWFKQFIDNEEIDKWVLHFTIDDNKFLPPNFAENLKKEYAGTVYYDRNILGLWVNAEGIIFRQFANNNSLYVLDNIERNKIRKIYIGVDFGGTVSKTMFVASALIQDNGVYKIVVLEEKHIKADTVINSVDSNMVCKEHYDFYNMIINKYGIVPDCSYCDHLDLVINQMKKYHNENKSTHKIGKVDKSRISLQDYILTINALFNLNKLYILKHNEYVINSFNTLLYDDKANIDAVLDRDNICDVDTYDAFRYSINMFLIYNRIYNFISTN